MNDESRPIDLTCAARAAAAVMRPAHRLARLTHLAVLFVFAILAWSGALAPAATAAQTDYANFDHLSTGFPLDGQHLNLKCEQCHVNGIFKGTPRQCSQCHTQGNPLSAVFMPANHIPTPQPCETCHVTNAFQGTHFAHANVMPGTCSQCHNNFNAIGKSANHVATNATGGPSNTPPGTSCDQCHTTVSFQGAFAVIPVGHIPTTQACSACHKAGYSPGTTVMSHAGISGGCTTCHAADAPATAPLTFTMSFPGNPPMSVMLQPVSQNFHVPNSAPPSHFPIKVSCDSCHSTPTATMAPTASAGGFAGGKMNHNGITSGCASCHADGSGPYIGVAALVLQSTKGPHIPVNGTACENCHKSTTVPGGFAGTAMVHTGLNGLSTCSSCHENNATNVGYFGITGKMVVRPPISGAQPDAATVVDASHPATGECSQCHSSTTSFSTNIALPGNHIPVGNTACANCHTGTTAPFAPANTVMNHAGFMTSCNNCHGSGKGPFYGTAQTEAGGQPMQPPGLGGIAAASPHIPYGSADCSGCHSSASTSQGGFLISATPSLSAAGHGAVSSLTCASCHYSSTTPGDVAWYGTTAKGAPGAVGTSGSANHIAFGTGDCKSCHGSNFSTGAFHISTNPQLAAPGHAAVTSVACATCHGTGAAWFGVTALQTSLATHITMLPSATCDNCHGTNYVTGGFKISSAPLLTQANHAYVSAADCNSCHETSSINPATITFQGVGANIFLRPGAAKGPDRSTADVAHTAGNLASPNQCLNCHTTAAPFQGGSLSANHMPLPSPTPACATCHAGGYGPTLSIMVHSVVTSETCTACHGAGKGPFSGTGFGTGGRPYQPPGTVGTPGAGNHIPVGSVDCKGCHASNDAETANGANFVTGTTPTLNAAGHTAINAVSCQSCHASGMAWFGTTIVVPPGTVGTSGTANHIALGTGGCSTCHATNIAVGGFKVTTNPQLAAAGHAAVSALSCASCHSTGMAWNGVTALQTALATHITMLPSATCDNCHGKSFTTGGFKISSSPLLTQANHAYVSAADCNSCHETSSINPATITFQGVGASIFLRPGATKGPDLSPADAAHAAGNLASPNQCVNCHTTAPPFQGGTLPGNHFPLPSPAPACSTCHAAGFGPTLSKMVHSVVTAETCTACHGAGKGPFAGTSQGTGGQPKQPPGTVGTPGAGNHIPVGTADCKGCHASSDTETAGGTNFKTNTTPALNPAGHTAVVSAVVCDTCHYVAGTTTGSVAWFGTNAKSPPGTVGTSGAANHIPLGIGATPEACSVCHASTNYTSFAGTAMNHTSIATSCSKCHNGGMAWYGVTIKTNTLSPAHIPVAPTPVCEGCHSASNFTSFGPGTAMNPTTHLQVPTTLETCLTCHEAGKQTAYYGVTIVTRPTAAQDAQHPPAPQDCGNSGCHTTTPPFTGGVKPSNHIPSSATCGNCHTGYTPATTTMNHSDSGVGTAGSPVACATCHGYGAGPYYGTAQGQAGGQPLQPPGTNGGAASTAQHLPFGTAACNICHTSTTVPGGFKNTTVPHTNGPFMTYTRGNGKSNTGTSTPRCVTCHAGGMKWFGVSFSTATMGSHQGSSTTADCIDCHSPQGGFAAAAARARPGLGLSKAAGSTVTVRGPNGLSKAAGSGSDAAGVFTHTDVTPGSCFSCHKAGGGATAKPNTHFLTTRACDSCHRNTATWTPVNYDHLSPRYRPQPGIVRCIDCHTTNTEIVVPGVSRPAGVKNGPGSTGKRN